MDEELRRMETI